MGMFTDSTNPYDIKSNTTSPLSILYSIYTGEGMGMFTSNMSGVRDLANQYPFVIKFSPLRNVYFMQ